MVYWNEDCDQSVKVREKAKQVAMKSRHPVDHVAFKRTKAVAKKAIKGAWGKNWQAFCSSLSNRSKVGTVWKVIKGNNNVKNSGNIPALKNGEGYVNTNVERANVMAEHFC